MQLLHRGKVRDVYTDRPGELILLASDRVSVFDAVLPTPIPDKGRILTALSLWWFEQLADIVDNHVISADDVPEEWKGRAIRCRQLDMVAVECIVRGYLAGSGWASYAETGAIGDVVLPPGLVEGDRLPEAVFTPTSKVPPGEGHDAPMTFAEVVELVGADLAHRLRDTTLALYRRAEEICAERGMLLVDTKFEFGLTPSGELVLADEAVTPDSSRFWRVEDWRPGGPQVAYDKQLVRDWAKSQSDWDETAPGDVPAEIVEAARSRYVATYERITGEPWS